MAAGAWALAEELFDSGDLAFVAELRRVHFADRLAVFAARWHADPRPFARAALFEYLALPLNCYRHEPLVKRLFKLADKAGDDELMGAFLVTFDRTVRRVQTTRSRFKQGAFSSRAEAEAAVQAWEAEGFERPNIFPVSGRFAAYAFKKEPAIVTGGRQTMPRPAQQAQSKDRPIPDAIRRRFERRFVLFSLPTRRYLRRRAWRYFRRLGNADPARYVKAATRFLPRYTDADVDSDIHLLDNWGLTHALFHHSQALTADARSWEFAAGKSAADLAATPYLESAWAADPPALFAVLLGANCRPVRRSAADLLRRHHAGWLAAQPVATLLKVADHADPDLSALGFDLLAAAPDLASVPVGEWLTRLDAADLDRLGRLCALLTRRLDPARVSTADAVRLAGHRAKPVAELGLSLLREQLALLRRTPFTAADAVDLLPLARAECAAVRPEIVQWLRTTLAAFDPVPAEWVLEFLDSKHADVRAAGWDWLAASPLRDDPDVWQKLIESPYDDVRGPLVAELGAPAAGADPDVVRLLWATVLLNVARGGRHKPGVIDQVVGRLARAPAEAERLLPLLAVAVRSLRGPEFRAGLAGVVRLAEENVNLLPAIRQRFPELQL
jgi:hypothetical protein